MTDRELVHQALDMLKQAKDSVADWGAYASEYFQHKHNLQGSIDGIQAQITVLSERLAQPEQKPPPWWPAVENILKEYGLQAMDFVADFKEAMQQAEQKPAAEVKLMTSGGNAGLATRIVEIDDHLRERLRPGQLLYTAPQPRQWRELTDEQADSIINGLRTCLHLDSKRMFLKTWLRDWAAHGIKGDTNAN